MEKIYVFESNYQSFINLRHLKVELINYFKNGDLNITLDFKNIIYVTSSFVALLMYLIKRILHNSREIKIINSTIQVKEYLTFICLDEYIDIKIRED